MRVLVVDDDALLRRSIIRTLRSAGFEIISAGDGREASTLLTEGSFDVVLTDIAMPEMNGIELLRAVRERDLEVPVLVMTGAPDLRSATEAVRYGACAYVMKPFDPDELVREVRRAADLSRLAKLKRESLRILESSRPGAGDRAGLEVALRRALDSAWMAYQPIVDAPAQRVFAYEALLRTREPALPNPGAVLKAAESLGRLDEVGRYVREKAPEPMDRAFPDCLLFVNLHAKDLGDESLFSPSGPLSTIAHRVVLEITERASLEHVEDVSRKIATLREIGFRIAIDDLGAGYAGLSTFTLLEPEFVKLDMSLIRGVHQSAIKQKLVQSMTSLCRDMGIVVIAEGIEIIDERDVVCQMGCNLLQGYLFAKPGEAFPDVSWP